MGRRDVPRQSMVLRRDDLDKVLEHILALLRMRPHVLQRIVDLELLLDVDHLLRRLLGSLGTEREPMDEVAEVVVVA